MEDLTEEPELEEEEQVEEEKDVEDQDEESDEEPMVNGKSEQPMRSQPVRSHTKRGRNALLQTNFSVTGLNEIKTEHIPTEHDHRIVLQCDITAEEPPSRPVSLHLNSTFTTFKPPRPCSALIEKVTAKMMDVPKTD